MKAENEMTLTFPSRSANEAFARAAVACICRAARPESRGAERYQDCRLRGGHELHRPRLSRDTIGTRDHPLPHPAGHASSTLSCATKGCGMEDSEKARKPMFTTGGEERSGMGFTIMESFMTELRSRRTRKGNDGHI